MLTITQIVDRHHNYGPWLLRTYGKEGGQVPVAPNPKPHRLLSSWVLFPRLMTYTRSIRTYMSVCIYIHAFVYAYMYVYIYIYICTYICVHIYIYMYRNSAAVCGGPQMSFAPTSTSSSSAGTDLSSRVPCNRVAAMPLFIGGMCFNGSNMGPYVMVQIRRRVPSWISHILGTVR